MKKSDLFLKEYFSRLNDDELVYVFTRLEQRLPNDLAEAINKLCQNQDIEKMLSAAKDADGLYDVVDKVQEYCDREMNKRNLDPVEIW